MFPQPVRPTSPIEFSPFPLMTNPHSNPWWLRLLSARVGKMLIGKSGLQAAIHNSGWIFFDKILRALFGLLVGAWVARYLGPSQFGELAYCVAFIALFQSIANLGLDGIVVREIANSPQRANIVLGTVFQLRLLIGFFLWVLAILVYGLINSFGDQGVWIIGLVGAGMIFQVADTVDLWFQGNSQSKRTVMAKACAYLIANGFKVGLILIAAPLMAFAALIAVEGALTALALQVAYKKFSCGDTWKRHLPEAKKLLRESWPYMVSGLSIMLYMRIDQLMIKSMLGERELGIFAAIIPISNLWNMVPVAICTSLAPLMAKKRAEGADIFEGALVKIFRFFWIFCFFVIGATWLLSGVIISLMYGQAYEDAVQVLNIYVLTSIPVFMGVGQGLWLLNERKSHISLVQTLTGAAVSILSNLMFLPWLGLQGAAIAAVISYCVSAIGVNVLFSRKLLLMQLGIQPKLSVCKG